MVRIGIDLLQVPDGIGDGAPGVLELARVAEDCGAYSVHMSDHLAVTRGAVERRTTYPWPWDKPWLEPLTTLAAVAAVTRSVQLATSVVISPLRPTIFLAKQIATLDVISGGRTVVGLGAGWLQEEFDAAGVPFADRRQILVDQIADCRRLWATTAATGGLPGLEELVALPVPVRGAATPITVGLPRSTRNFAVIARIADGWLPLGVPPAVLPAAIDELTAALVAAGRTRSEVTVTAALPIFSTPGAPTDLDDVVERVAAYAAAGADEVLVRVVPFCETAADVGRLIARLNAL